MTKAGGNIPPRNRIALACSGATLLFALIFAPWCWGCTWPAGVHVLDLLLLAATALCLMAGARPTARLPLALKIAVAIVLVQGWAMTLNSRSLWAAASGLFAPLEQPLSGWPGSLERDLSGEAMARLTGLVGAALIAASLGTSRRWRRRIYATMVVTGASVVLLGCWQRWTGAGDIFWNRTRHLDYFFATYRNVTNAGEYLNFIAPLAAALALITAVNRESPLKKAGAGCAAAIILAGAFVCGSKIAPLLAAVLFILFLVLQGGQLRRIQSRTKLLPATGFILLVAVALIIQGSGLGVASDRWQRLFHDTDSGATLTNRLWMDRDCLAAAPEVGALGFGPGTFEAVIPSFEAGHPLSGSWIYAHNDYLQTWIEWGAAGTLAWTIYFFGACHALAHGFYRRGWRTEDRIGAAGLLVSLTGIALMALIDFPLQIASIQLQVAVALGLGWSSFAWPRSRTKREGKGSSFGPKRSPRSPLSNQLIGRGSRDNRRATPPPAGAFFR